VSQIPAGDGQICALFTGTTAIYSTVPVQVHFG